MIYVIFFTTAGAPATGLSPTLITYKKVSDGSDVGSPPAVTEIGGGGYKFTATPAEALFVVIDGGAALTNAFERYKVMQVTPNDGYLDVSMSSRSTATQGATAGELAVAVSPLALEASLEAHITAALNSYDPPTRAEATADKQAVLDALASAGITVTDILEGDLSDSETFPAGSLADRIRKLFWVLCNRLVIIDATGALAAYKDDGTTPGATGTIIDDGTITEREAPTWP